MKSMTRAAFSVLIELTMALYISGLKKSHKDLPLTLCKEMQARVRLVIFLYPCTSYVLNFIFPVKYPIIRGVLESRQLWTDGT